MLMQQNRIFPIMDLVCDQKIQLELQSILGVKQVFNFCTLKTCQFMCLLQFAGRHYLIDLCNVYFGSVTKMKLKIASVFAST